MEDDEFFFDFYDDEPPFDPCDDDLNLPDGDFDNEPLEYEGPYAGEGGIDF